MDDWKVAFYADDAKEILGFPRNYEPTPSEISKAWKAKSFENHPDRGGDPFVMKDINIAKEILDGKRREDSTPRYKDPVQEYISIVAEHSRTIVRIFKDTIERLKSNIDRPGFMTANEVYTEIAENLDLVHDSLERQSTRGAKLALKLCHEASSQIARLLGKSNRTLKKLREVATFEDFFEILASLETYKEAYLKLHGTFKKLSTIYTTQEDIDSVAEDNVYRISDLIDSYRSIVTSEVGIQSAKANVSKEFRYIQDIAEKYHMDLPADWDRWFVPGDLDIVLDNLKKMQ